MPSYSSGAILGKTSRAEWLPDRPSGEPCREALRLRLPRLLRLLLLLRRAPRLPNARARGACRLKLCASPIRTSIRPRAALSCAEPPNMMISPGLKVHAGRFSSLITRWRAHWRRLGGGSIGSRAGMPSSMADGAVTAAAAAAANFANSAAIAVAASSAAAAAAAAERRNEEGDERGDKEAITTGGRGEAFPLVSCVGCVGKALAFCDEMPAACRGRRGDSLRSEARAASAGRLLPGAPTARATATSIRFCATAGSTYGSVYTEPT